MIANNNYIISGDAKGVEIDAKEKTDKLDLFLFGFALVASSFTSLNTIGLYVCVPVLILRCFSRGSRKIFSSKQVKLYVFLLFWILFCCLAGEDIRNSLDHYPVILAAGLISFCAYLLGRNTSNIKALLYLYIAFYAGLLIYLIINGDLSIVTYDSGESDRAGGAAMNANNYAYYLPFLTVAVYYLFIEKAENTLLIIGLFLALGLFSLYISMLTASRQVLIIQVPLFLLLLLLKYNSSRSKYLPIIIGGVLVALLISARVISMYENSLLAKRSEVAIDEDNRAYALRNAFKVGCEHIVTGVGPGNYLRHDVYGQFTHCSYAELFACTGLLGAVLFLLIFITFLKDQIKWYKKTRDRDSLLFIITTVIYLLQNFFYVYYIVPWLMAFPFILFGYSDSKFKRL